MRSSSCLRLVLPLLLLGATELAHGAPTSVGLLAVDGSAVEPGMGAILTDALRRNLPQLHGMRIEPRTQELAEVKMVFGCSDERADCLTKVGRNLEVSRLIYGSIRKQAGNYTVVVRQLNVSDGTVEKTLSETVPKQLLMQPSLRLDDLCQRWLRSLLVEGLRGGVVINSNPPGALVYVDGQAVGRTPFAASSLDVGNHVIKLELTGYDQVVKTAQVRGNQTTTIDEQLATRLTQPEVAAPEKPGRAIHWVPILRYSSYALYGLAAVSAIAAIGSWAAMSKAEDRASSNIDTLIAELGPRAVDYAGFFSNRGKLSSCQGPSGLAGNAASDAYLADCQSGNRLAGAASGLWVAAGTFGVAGVAAMLTSHFMKKSDAVVPSERTDKPISVRVLPQLGPNGAMVHAAFDF
jgi:hypothetical protein